MLINSVILFIKDFLPICILLCFASAFFNLRLLTFKHMITMTVIIVIGIILTYLNLSKISLLFNGGGIEVFQTIVIIITYMSLLLCSPFIFKETRLKHYQHTALLIALILYSIMNLSEFFLYLLTSLANENTLANTFVGMLLGFGICLSFSALLYLFLNNVMTKHLWPKKIIWCLYLSGILAGSLKKLQQIDLIHTGDILWNTSDWIADSSEYGYVLNALLGYVATPTLIYVITYLFSVSLFLIYCFSSFFAINSSQNNNLRSSK